MPSAKESWALRRNRQRVPSGIRTVPIPELKRRSVFASEPQPADLPAPKPTPDQLREIEKKVAAEVEKRLKKALGGSKTFRIGF